MAKKYHTTTASELEYIREEGEGYFLEFKKSVHSDLGKSMVEIFDDRVEIYNPGGLPKPLTPALFGSRSVCRNPLLASLMLRCTYIEKMGTGIKRIREGLEEARCPDMQVDYGGIFGLLFPRPDYVTLDKVSDGNSVTGQVTGQVIELLKHCLVEKSRADLMEALQLKGRDNFEKVYLHPALHQNLIERTIPDKPTSRLQKYRLTSLGKSQLSLHCADKLKGEKHE